MKALPLSLLLAASLHAFAHEIESDRMVGRDCTAIDAILAIGSAVDEACAAMPGEPIVIRPLSTNDVSTYVRNAAVNRELFWFVDVGRNVRLADSQKGQPSKEGGSHLWRRSGRNKDRWWYDRLRAKRDEIRALDGGEVDIVMVGDSITHEWDRPPGDVVLEDLRRTYSVLNLGYGGDKFQQALWRAKNGELDGYRARCVTLLIGTNNSQEDVQSVAAGIVDIVDVIREKQPGAKVLLMAIFPRCTPSQRHLRERSERVTELIRKCADGENVVFCDFRGAFLKADGTGRFDLLLDGTHPGRTGLRVWRDLMLPYFERFTGKRHEPHDPVRRPFAQRWISYAVDMRKPGSAAEAGRFIATAAKSGFTGICIDAFGKELDAAAVRRLGDVKEAAVRAGVDIIPVMRQMAQGDFERAAAAADGALHPSKWMIVTNGLACTDRAKLKEAAIRQIGVIGRISPGAKCVLHMKALNGFGGGIPRNVVMASQWNDSYFRKNGWPIAVLGEINNPTYSLHYTGVAMRESEDGEVDTAIYWTDLADYRLIEDFARLSMKRE